MRLAQLREPGEQPGQVVSRQLAALAGGALTLEGSTIAAPRCATWCASSTPAFAIPSSVRDRKSTRLNSSHSQISYAGFCLTKTEVNAPPIAYEVDGTEYIAVAAGGSPPFCYKP